ncbi:CDP-glycerol glycerophosphotransferase family protein [Arthrobacter sp. Sa2CUA1]|uniref:CDP-glycerol glycerophosphotransferase family protein n=1 Tax=Arthrobacter gallicola TaxID=2762225 RepID=A0ABR8UPJ5_9MICC|nr:CDP-glycerol glycerophosphotransferase family protein [Arthrobacter gallicola]MBD7994480.1 CDP-glycerol glycerophosphotransferase family protein [Arthrobacter gallicola]
MNALPQAASRLAASVHPALRSRLKRLAPGTPRSADHGLVSVVVPMFNVAPYLQRCLNSLVSQTYRRLEIILVDDGSTDATASIAAGYARHDPRIRLIRLPHAGNGRARNVGVKAARGRFLAFADADDVVPLDAYEIMATALAESGSDFCVGSYGRIRGSRRTRVQLADRLHREEAAGVQLASRPGVIDDVFLWNKMFTRTFWEDKVGPIPEGVRYEDQETTARAYLRAASFDILTQLVYWWRIREDGSSLTQEKHLDEDLRDRLSVARAVTDLYAAEAPADVLAHWHRRLLGSDLLPYLEQVPDASEEFWTMLHRGAAGLLTAGQPYLDGVDPQARVLLYLAAEGRRADLTRAVVDRINSGTASPLVFDGARIEARPPFLEVLAEPVPPDLLTVGAEQLELITSLEPAETSAVPQHTGRRLHGYAYVRNVDLRSISVDITAGTAGPDGFGPLEVQRRADPDLDMLSGDRNCSYADSAFAVVLPEPAPAELVLRVDMAGHRLEQTVQVPADRPGPHVADPPAANPRTGALRVASLSAAAPDDLEMQLSGGAPGGAYALATARHTIPAEATARPDGSVSLRFALSAARWGRKVPAPPSGSYTLRWRADGAQPGPGDPAVPVSEAAAAQFRSFLLPAARVRGFRTAAGAMAVSIGAPLADDETGTFHQYRLRRAAFPRGLSGQAPELQPGIFFESYGGKSCTDSPRAISDYLASAGFDEPLYWSVADRSVDVPAYAVPLLQGSSQWYEKLATTRRLVNNNNFPWYFRKSPGQFYLQTWHGTPLKKIGLDAPQRALALSYRDLLQREARYWDLLLAQNGFAAGVLPQALGYPGEVLTAGYPRNDALLTALDTGADTRDRVRELLGIPAGQRVVLYAPTWRDAVRDDAGRSDWVGYLDLELASRRLGPGYTFLIRGHHNVAAQRRIAAAPNALDVTEYPEINDLYLASDVLVTDYSSAMFDFAVLGRPMYFLAPDLAGYQESRGLYLDYAATVPGDPLPDTAALVQALRQDDSGLRERVRGFAARFAAADRGLAAAAAGALLTAEGHPVPGSTHLQTNRPINRNGDHRG